MFPLNVLIDKKMFTCGNGFFPCWFILVFGKGPLYNVNKNMLISQKCTHIFRRRSAIFNLNSKSVLVAYNNYCHKVF